MDRKNLADVTRIAEEAGVATPIELFRRFDPEAARPAGPEEHAPDEVPDPYGGTLEEFAEVVRICRRTARTIVDRWPVESGEVGGMSEERTGR